MLKRLKWMGLLMVVFVCLIMASCSNNTTNTPNTPDNTDPGQSSTTHQHTWGEWNTVQDATCENKGYKTRTCSGCSETEREDIEAKGHSFGEWETVTESTCTIEGQKKRVCSACNTEETDAIAAKGHTFGESVQTVAPNCTDDGESKKVCTVCEHEETEVIPANGHNYVDYICSVCKAVVAEKAVQTVKIANTSLLLPLNTEVKLDVQVYPADALYTSVTYTIDERNNSCGATITEDGVLSCTQLGSVRIRVTVDNVSSAYVTFNVPTEIRTAAEFDAIRNNLKGYYILCNDIDLSAYSTWTPIGYATKAADGSLSYSGTGFQGEFNGNGYTISGVNIDLAQTNLITVGLFGFVDTSAVVSNVKVEANVIGTASASEYIGTLTGVNYGVVDNCEVTSTVNISGALYVGGIVGQNNGNLTDCAADVSIKASNSNSNGYYVGGIAGQFVIGNMDNNTAKANIEITSCNFCYVGGITGNAYGSFSGTNCDATIVVSANSSATSYVGGVVGKVEDSDSEIAFDLNNTTITGSITVTKANKLYVGGIAGYGDVFSNCINDVDITVTSSNNTYVGGIAGRSTKISNSKNNGAISVNSTSTVYVGGIAGSTDTLNDATNYTDISVTAATTYFGGVAGEAATAQNVYNYCYELSVNASNAATFGGVLGKCTQKLENSYNTANLKVTRSDSGLYLGGIVGDSDATSNTVKNATNSGKIIVDVSKLNTVYIGGIAGKAASVSNSANSATVISIKATSLSGSSNQINVGGLCGSSSANIENGYSYANITLENANMSAPSGYKAVIGGLVGTAKNVSGSYSTGDVSVSLYNGSVNAGGLVGNLSGTASDSYARGSVTGVTTNEIKLGGLVAYAQSSASVQNCYAAYNYLTTNITSNGSTAYVGGLVAHNLGTVTDSYAMNYINTIGSGSGDTIYAGGVIGYNNGTVSKSYSSSATEHVLNTDIPVDIDCTSNLSANVYVGGFVGYNNKTITNCYASAEVIGRGCYTGGFVGYQNTSGKISYALALAPVNSGISGQTHTGGFSGNDAGSYTSCIFSTTGTQISADNGAGGTTVSGIVGKSETELLNTSTLSGFDTSVWTIASGSIPTLTLNNNWKVYNDGYDNFNVLKNVVNPDRQYVKVSDSTVEIKFESNWDIPLLDTVLLEKGSQITMFPDLLAEGYAFIGWFTDAEFTKPFTVNGTYTVNEDITLYAYFRKIIATPESQSYTYNEEKITLGTLDLTDGFYTIEGVYEATDAGEYAVTLILNKNYCWNDNNIDVATVTWFIKNKPVSIPQSQTYTYSGEEFSLTTLDLTGRYYTIDGIYEATDAGEYTVALTLNKNYCWSDNSIDAQSVMWEIQKKSIAIPEGHTYIFIDELITLETLDLSGFFYTIEGDYEAKDSGEYTVYLFCTKNTYWEGTDDCRVEVKWYINRRVLSVDEQFAYTGETICIAQNNDLEKYCIISGINNAKEIGEYTVSFQIKDKANCNWEDGTTENKTVRWYITQPWDGSFDISWYNSNENVFVLSTPAQLAGFASLVNGGTSFENVTVTLGGVIDLSNIEWIPIGQSGQFLGTFDGNENAIYNLKISGNHNIVGLFGNNNGIIKDVILKKSSINVYVGNANVYAGFLAGKNLSNGVINNCYTEGTLEASCKSNTVYTYGNGFSYVGGLVGYNYGSITNCIANGNMSSNCYFGGYGSSYPGDSANSYAGGLVGVSTGVVECCYANANVSSYTTASSATAGGLIGSNSGSINNCYSEGNVIAFGQPNGSYYYRECVAGGLVGYHSGKVNNCYSTSTVSAQCASSSSYGIRGATSGGLVGECSGEVYNCYAIGDIYCTADYGATGGGLMGSVWNNSILDNNYKYEAYNFDITNGSNNRTPNTEGISMGMSELQSITFHTDIIKWDSEIWNFVEGEHPTLKNVGASN